MARMSREEIEELARRLPRVDLASLGQGLAGGITGATIGDLLLQRHSPLGALGGATAGALIGTLGSARRREIEEMILRSALQRRPVPTAAEDVRLLARRMSPAAGSTLGTAGLSGLLSAALGGALGGARGALYSGLGGAGVGAAVGALHTAANRARIRKLIRQEAARQAGT